MGELDESPVDVPGRRVHVLEEEDRAVEVDLPGRSHGLHEEPEAAACKRRRGLAANDGAHVGVVRVARDLARAAAPQNLEEARSGERRRLLVAHACDTGAVERGETRALPDRDVEGGDVGIADERLRVRGDDVEVEEGNRLRRPVAALHAVDDVDLGVGEEGVQVVGALLGRARDEVVPSVDPRRQLDAVPLRFPPLDSAEKIGAVLPRARGRGDADGPAVGKGAGEEMGRFQDVNLPPSRRRSRDNRLWLYRSSPARAFVRSAISSRMRRTSSGGSPAGSSSSQST